VTEPASDEVISRATRNKKQDGKSAAIEASQRTSAVLEIGDNFNHEPWLRVTMVVNEIDRTNAGNGKTII
jgi:hypothetical protein